MKTSGKMRRYAAIEYTYERPGAMPRRDVQGGTPHEIPELTLAFP